MKTSRGFKLFQEKLILEASEKFEASFLPCSILFDAFDRVLLVTLVIFSREFFLRRCRTQDRML